MHECITFYGIEYKTKVAKILKSLFKPETDIANLYWVFAPIFRGWFTDLTIKLIAFCTALHCAELKQVVRS